MKFILASLLLPTFAVAYSTTTTTSNTDPTFVDNFGDTWRVHSATPPNTAATQVVRQSTTYNRPSSSSNVAGTQVTNPSSTGVSSTFLDASGVRWALLPTADGTVDIANVRKVSNPGVAPTVVDPVSTLRSPNSAPAPVSWGPPPALSAQEQATSNVAATQVNPSATASNGSPPTFVDAFGDTWQINSNGVATTTAGTQVNSNSNLRAATTYYTQPSSSTVASTQLTGTLSTPTRPGGAATPTFMASNGSTWQVLPSADGTSNIANAQRVPVPQQQQQQQPQQYIPQATILIVDDQPQQPGRGSIRGASSPSLP